MRPVVSIWILDGELFHDGLWFHEFSLHENPTGMLLCDDETILVIELSRWGEELDIRNPSEVLDDLRIKEALDIMAAFTKSEAARDLYRR